MVSIVVALQAVVPGSIPGQRSILVFSASLGPCYSHKCVALVV